MASGCSTTRSIRTPPRRASASSSPRICRASAPTSRRSSPSAARTSPHSRCRSGSSASRASSTGSVTTSRCVPAFPRQVKETLSKSADFNIYVRDRKPQARFAGKAYVLPRTGQRGIPVVSVNTAAVALEIYRIGDRNLLETVMGRDFQRNLDRYDLNRLTEERGSQVWKGEMAVEQVLNTDVTTSFPVGEAIGALSPGIYVM